MLMSLQLPHIKADPLDALLFVVGLRLSQLAKTGDEKFKGLLQNRNFTIQIGSELENIQRYFAIDDGNFSQHDGTAENPTLTISFKDSLTGVKLLTKGDATAFMVGIQNGDVKMSGDYSLLLWFNQVAKYIVPKVPEQLQPVVEKAKPYIAKATPIAKEFVEKAQPIAKELVGKAQEFFSENIKKNNKSGYQYPCRDIQAEVKDTTDSNDTTTVIKQDDSSQDNEQAVLQKPSDIDTKTVKNKDDAVNVEPAQDKVEDNKTSTLNSDNSTETKS